MFKQFPRTFWVANTMEIFERMAWYGFFVVSSVYITGSIADGGLGFTSEQRGFLQGVVTFILYLLPVLTGALADRYGYKKMFIIAFFILVPGYYLLGQFHSFGTFFAVFLFVALGAAIFKPVVIGTVARTTNALTSSLGFGIFYMMVNIGGFIGPIIAGIVRGWAWKWVFIMSAVWIAFNLVLVTLLYKEPTEEAASQTRRTLRKVFSDIVEVIGNGRLFLFILILLVLLMLGVRGFISPTTGALAAVIWVVINLALDLFLKSSSGQHWFSQPMRIGNWQFILFLVILSGFWTIFNQLFMSMPEYIRDFTNTQPIILWVARIFGAVGLPGLHDKLTSYVAGGGQINPEFLINLDAAAIILLQVVVSWVMKRFKPFFTMTIGVLVASLGIALAAWGTSGWLIVASIVILALGEMTVSPKSMEYVGRIVPQDKVGMYMGYFFVAIALGNLFGGILSGELYGKFARDMGRPDIMWMIFAALGFMTTVALFVYNRAIICTKEASDIPMSS